MRVCGIVLLLVLGSGLPATAETVRIEAARDATLIEDPEGAWANGSGPYFFVGRTSQARNAVRRGLVYFDVSAALPRNAVIESAALTLHVGSGNLGTRKIRVHRVLGDWSEGPSSSSGGGGAPSLPGDVTWLHTSYDRDYWVHRGGQFVRRLSAREFVGASGSYTWESTAHLVQDVRLWNANPRLNFGWILIGDETTPQNSKRFASRDNLDVAMRPVLEITYRRPGRAGRRFD